MQLLQALKPEDKSQRKEFAVSMLYRLDSDPGFLKRVCFSDESTFHVSGLINRHNSGIRGSQNPHETYELEREGLTKTYRSTRITKNTRTTRITRNTRSTRITRTTKTKRNTRSTRITRIASGAIELLLKAAGTQGAQGSLVTQLSCY